MPTTLADLPDNKIAEIKMVRWKARTDLEFLCTRLLNYKNVEKSVHGPVLEALQKFQKPTKKQFYDNDKIINGKWVYEPVLRMDRLPGKRRVLILDPRSHLKTTINAQSHAIQWILNYPDVAVLIIQSSLDKAEMILDEIKNHFMINPLFRAYFPEHCPRLGVKDWGTKAQFTTEARSNICVRRESTVMAGSIDKGLAGVHFDVIKFSDIVDPVNAQGIGLESVRKSFYMMHNLLVAPKYWIDVEGTRYNFADTYGKIIESEEQRKKDGLNPLYHIHVRGVFKKKTPDGLPQKFTPEEIHYPYLLAENGKRISWWPYDNEGRERFTLEMLEAEEKDDPYIFSAQKENKPIGGVDGKMIFPVEEGKYPRWLPVTQFRQKIRVHRYEIALDTAETDTVRANYSAFAVAAIDGGGRYYIVDIVYGKWLADELCRRLIALAKFYKPAVIKIEKTSYVNGLMPTIQRYMDLSGLFIPVELIPPDNQTRKEDRIRLTLQPWYMSQTHDLRFVEPFTSDVKDIYTGQPPKSRLRSSKEQLIKELQEFPLGTSDDVLDALADLFQGKSYFGREEARPTFDQHVEDEMLRFLRLEPPEWPDLTPTKPMHPFYSKTGGL